MGGQCRATNLRRRLLAVTLLSACFFWPAASGQLPPFAAYLSPLHWPPSARCLPLAAHPWPSTTGRLLLAAFRLLLAAHSWPPLTNHLPLASFGRPPTTGHLLLVANCWPSTAGRQLLAAYCWPPTIVCLLLRFPKGNRRRVHLAEGALRGELALQDVDVRGSSTARFGSFCPGFGCEAELGCPDPLDRVGTSAAIYP